MAPKLKTERLTIRELNDSDLRSFVTYRAMPSIAEFQDWSDYTYEDASALLKEVNEAPFGTVGRWFQLAIIDKTLNQVAGDLAVHFIDNDQVKIGFTIAPEFHKKGIAFEALKALLDFLFKDLSKHRVIAITDARNKAAYGLLAKAGFRKEAHFVENIFFKGSWGSEYLFAMLGSDWTAQVRVKAASQNIHSENGAHGN
jgi:RimJ/RimL family protein N-acetyltransferase